MDLGMIGRAGLGHVGGDLSVLDILTTCFRGAAGRPGAARLAGPGPLRAQQGARGRGPVRDPGGDGFFPPPVRTFAGPLSALNGHPNRVKVPGVETNTGPLGHGLPVAVGMAVAGRLSGSPRHVYVVLGDGELQEGSNWEAAMTAGHRRLVNLTAVVDRNRLQQGARTEDTYALDPLDDRFRASAGTSQVDGHDPLGLAGRVHAPRGERPDLRHRHHRQGSGRGFHGRPRRVAPPSADRDQISPATPN